MKNSIKFGLSRTTDEKFDQIRIKLHDDKDS
jgi:hypothetical protein